MSKDDKFRQTSAWLRTTDHPVSGEGGEFDRDATAAVRAYQLFSQLCPDEPFSFDALVPYLVRTTNLTVYQAGNLTTEAIVDILQQRVDREAVHSDDFRSARWYGSDYTFTPTQAACVKVLWEHRDRGTPEVGGETVLELVDSDRDRFAKVFSRHPAWGSMIVSGKTKGTYRLNTPPE